MIEAILWDNDGVLVDTEPLYLRANREILAEIGIEIDDDAYRELSLKQGRSVFSLAEARGMSAGGVASLKARRDDRYASLIDDGVEILDGIPECLASLRGRVRMAIVTSSTRRHFDRIHVQTGLLEYFEFSVAAGDYERHKPHPDPYLMGAERLGLPPDRCLAIEDTERGLVSAAAAGMPCLVIPRPLSRDGDFGAAHSVLEGASDVVGAFDELRR